MEEQLRNFVDLLKNKKERFSKEVLEFIQSWGILSNSELIGEKKQLNNGVIREVLTEISNKLLQEGISFNNPDYNYIKDLEFKKIPVIQRFQMINSSFDIFTNSIKENTRITDEKITSDELRELAIDHLISLDESEAYLFAEILKNSYIKIVSRSIDTDWYDLNIYVNKASIDFANKNKTLVTDYFKDKGPDFIQPLEDIVFKSAPDACFINIAFDPDGALNKLVLSLKKNLHEINYLSAREVNIALELGKDEKLLASVRLLLIISEEILNEVHYAFFNDKDKLTRISYKAKLLDLETKGLQSESHAFYNINELRNIFIHALTKHNDQSSLIFRFKEVVEFIKGLIMFKQSAGK